MDINYEIVTNVSKVCDDWQYFYWDSNKDFETTRSLCAQKPEITTHEGYSGAWIDVRYLNIILGSEAIGNNASKFSIENRFYRRPIVLVSKTISIIKQSDESIRLAKWLFAEKNPALERVPKCYFDARADQTQGYYCAEIMSHIRGNRQLFVKNDFNEFEERHLINIKKGTFFTKFFVQNDKVIISVDHGYNLLPRPIGSSDPWIKQSRDFFVDESLSSVSISIAVMPYELGFFEIVKHDNHDGITLRYMSGHEEYI